MKKETPSTYIEISYKDLGNYVGNKAIVQVRRSWLDLLIGKTDEEYSETSKECSKCKESLPLNKFNNDKRRKFGKRSQCKSCYKERSNTKITKTKVYPKSPKNSDPEKEDKISYTLINLNNE